MTDEPIRKAPATVDAGPPPPRPRAVGGPVLAALLPGLPQLRAGRWGGGVAALLAWLGMWAIVVLEPGRVLSAPAAAWAERIALLTLIGVLVAAWTWSRRDLRRSATPEMVGVSPWELAVRTYSKDRFAVAGLIVVVALCVIALVTPLIAPFDPTTQGNLLTDRFLPPSALHPLGTDHLGRDALSRLMYGSRISLAIGLLSVAISVTIGTTLGAVAGYLGGVVDTAIMRAVDVIISFPRLILLIAIIAVFERSILVIVLVLGLTLWPSTARIVRGEVLSVREREYIQAAKALGYPTWRIITRHVMPNVLAPVIVAATLGIGNTIVLEAGLSFLGIGVQAPTPSWGGMAADGRRQLVDAWWLSTFSGLAIVFTVLCFNLVGDGLRDALDPRQRR